MKQIEVQIMGQGYVLGCPEGGEGRLAEAVRTVDEAMCKIRDAGKIKARDRISVLAALNLAFDLADKPSSSVLDSGPSQEKLQTLLHRLDQALASDNQLL